MALMERRTAVVTGAARGLGLAVSTAFLAEGARVVMADRNLDEVRHAATTIDPDGDRTLVSSCDVTDAAAVTDLVAEAKSWHGSVDVMVNNAGFTRDATMRKMSEDDFDAVIGVHLRGAWLGTRAAAAIMREQPNGGSIVNVSSISGKVGNPGQTNYSAAKAGVVGLTKAAAKEVGFAGVRVNAVQPGIIETEMTAAMPEDVRRDRLAEVPLGRFGEPREVASVAVFLASDMSSYLTGAVIEISGGRNL